MFAGPIWLICLKQVPQFLQLVQHAILLRLTCLFARHNSILKQRANGCDLSKNFSMGKRRHAVIVVAVMISLVLLLV